MSDVQICKWVKDVFYGDTAKRVLDLSAAGLGYIVIDNHKENNRLEVTAAFRVAEDKEMGYSLSDCSDSESDKFDEMLKRKQGVPNAIR